MSTTPSSAFASALVAVLHAPVQPRETVVKNAIAHLRGAVAACRKFVDTAQTAIDRIPTIIEALDKAEGKLRGLREPWDHAAYILPQSEIDEKRRILNKYQVDHERNRTLVDDELRLAHGVITHGEAWLMSQNDERFKAFEDALNAYFTQHRQIMDIMNKQ